MEYYKETNGYFHKEIKSDVEEMIFRNSKVEFPKGYELSDEDFLKLQNQTFNGDTWVDYDRWYWEDEDMFGDLEDYEDEILECLGFKWNGENWYYEKYHYPKINLYSVIILI